MNTRFKIMIAFLAVAALGCGKKEEAPKADANVAVIEITSNDQMQFNLKTIEVKAGQKVRLTLKHTGQMPKQVMGHNVVILKPGVDLAEFAGKAAKAADNDYIPADEADNIIAHTAIIGGGETTTIEFTAPAAGTYKFICSFPGHFMTMQGDFIVK